MKFAKQLLVITIAGFLSGCGGSDSTSPSTPPPEPNRAPVVTIEDVTADELEQAIFIANSSDADGDPLSYSWQQTSGEPLSYTASANQLTVDTQNVDQDTEYRFEVTVSDASARVSASASLTVIDNTPRLTVSDISVTEGDDGLMEALISVTLDRGPKNPLSVDYATEDDSAIAGDDYRVASGQVNFAAGEMQMHIPVQIIGDVLYSDSDPTETFHVVFNSSGDVMFDTSVAKVTIDNDDLSRDEARSMLVELGKEAIGTISDRAEAYQYDDNQDTSPTTVHSYYDIDHGGDGDLDVILMSQLYEDHSEHVLYAHNLILFENLEGKGFVSRELTVAATGRDAEIQDFNGDGLEDIYFAEHGYDAPPFPGHQDVLVLQKADGSFEDVTETNVPKVMDFSHASCSGDFDNDGSNDVVTVMGNDVKLRLNDGLGVLVDKSVTHLPIEIVSKPYIEDNGLMEDFTELEKDAIRAPNYWWCGADDFNGDGADDILLGGSGNYESGGMDIYRNDANFKHLMLFNDGTGKFRLEDMAYIDFLPFDSVSTNVLSLDYNGDNCMDFVIQTTDYNTRQDFNAYLNDCEGNFQLLDNTSTDPQYMKYWYSIAKVTPAGQPLFLGFYFEDMNLLFDYQEDGMSSKVITSSDTEILNDLTPSMYLQIAITW